MVVVAMQALRLNGEYAGQQLFVTSKHFGRGLWWKQKAHGFDRGISQHQ